MNSLRNRAFLICAWLTLYLMGTDVFIMSPLLPLISRSYGVTVAQGGWGVTVFALAYALLAPLFGHYGDQYGRRMPLVLGLVVLGLGNAGTALAPTFKIFLLVRLLAGSAAAAITPTIYAATSDVAPKEKRGMWLAIVGSGMFTALWSSAPMGSLMGYRSGWQNVFLILGAVPIVLAEGHFLILQRTQGSTPPSTGSYGPLLRDVSVTCLWSVALYATYTYLGAGLESVTRATPEQIALAVAFYGVGMVVGVLCGGKLADKFGATHVTLASAVLLAVASLVLRAAMAQVTTALPALLFFSASAALFFPSYQTFLAHHHHDRRGAALAWNNSALYVGVTAGSFLGGIVLTHFGFLCVPIMSCAFAVATYFWGRNVQRRRHSAATVQ